MTNLIVKHFTNKFANQIINMNENPEFVLMKVLNLYG